MGVFYPLLAFEGATLLVLTGGLGELLGGHFEIAFDAVTLLAIAGDYLGALWLSRQLGLRGLLAHAPGLTIITSAYFITNLYGRGAWPEFMAVASIVPLAASGLCLARARVWRPGAVLVFVLSVVILTGSHNITMVWAPVMGALFLFTIWLACGRSRELPYRRLAMLVGLGAVGVMINAWYLVTDVLYERFVGAHITTASGATMWQNTAFLNTPAVLLDPLRSVPSQSTTPGLYAQAPVWLLAWGVLAGVLLLSRGSAKRTLRRLWLAAFLLVSVTLAMIMVKAFWNAVPFPFDEIQFPYRLSSYVYYAVAGLVLVSALIVQRSASRRVGVGLRAALLGACMISVGLCIWQQWAANSLFPDSYSNRGEALASVNVAPHTWYNGNEAYSDRQAPVIAVPGGRLLLIQPSEVHGDRFAAWLQLPDGPQPIQTDIDGGAYLVRISGVRRIGRNSEGYAVVQRVGKMQGPVYVTVETAHRLIITLGRALSVTGVLLLLGLLIWTGGHRRRRVLPVPNPRRRRWAV